MTRASLPISVSLAALILAAGAALAPPQAGADANGADSSLDALATQTAAAIQSQFSALLAPLAHPPASGDCADPSANARWAEALGAQGDFQACIDAAAPCREEAAGADSVFFAAAQCARSLSLFPEAYRLFDLATAPAHARSPEFAGHVLLFAEFAESTDRQAETRAILARSAEWRFPSQADWTGDAINYLSTGDARGRDPQALDGWIAARIAGADATLRPWLIAGWANHLLRHKYRYSDAIQYLVSHLGDLRNPHSWFNVAYLAFYSLDAARFPRTERIYASYLPYAHARAWLPLEQNTHTYSELYRSVSADRLLQGPAFARFAALKTSWVSGALPSEKALVQAQAMLTQFPQAADLLALAGGIADHLGQEDAAMTYFWKAHQLCPWFNRAHWGLARILYRQKERTLSDYAASLARIDREISGIPLSPDLPKYVLNWAFLGPEAQKRLRYAIRFWAPYISRLYRSGARLYVKAGVQYLSDVPGLEELKDTRIQYDHDNRLWDDVRGEGGGIVAVDYDQMMDGAFGDFNLAGHEVTHQFQGGTASASLLPSAQFDCSVALYDAARSRGVFADPYAGRNFLEYLAQGVAYWMIPADSPARYGINVQWLKEHDPDLLAFLDALQVQSDDPSRIRCPIAIH